MSAESQALSRERHLFDELLNPLTDAINDLKTLSQSLAELDVLSSLALVASHERWIEPVLSESVEIQITNGRHPVIEKASSQPFVPNDTQLTPSITSINHRSEHGWKVDLHATNSTHYTACAHRKFVPADRASIGPVDRIFTRIGASDDLAGGRSAFMVEMTETAAICSSNRPITCFDGRGWTGHQHL